MIVAGRVVMKMVPVMQRIWLQMPEPKWCISMGACASTGGVFDTYTMIQGVDQFIQTVGTPERARLILGQRVSSQLGAEIGNMEMDDLVSIEPTKVQQGMGSLRNRLLGARALAQRT